MSAFTAPSRSLNTPSIISKITSLFHTAKTCGFAYSLYLPSETNVNSNYVPPLNNGQFFISNNNSTLIIHYADRTGATGINLPLSKSTLLITDGVSKYQISVSNLNTQLDMTSYFTATIDISGIPKGFFNHVSTYILSECGVDSYTESLIMENNLWTSFLVFLGLIALALLIINYKYVYDIIIYVIYPPNAGNANKKHEGGKHIFYVGGYDYRDYSD